MNHIVAGQPLPGEAGSSDGFSMPLWGWIVIGASALLAGIIILSRVFGIEVRRR